MKYNKLSRRMFLQGSGSLLAIPFLESLAPSEARAQASVPVKRYINYCLDFDTGHNRNWLPKLTTLANPIDIPGNPQKGSYESLAAILATKTQLSPIFGPAFNQFASKMMFYKGLDVVSHGVHGGNSYQLGSMHYVGYGALDALTDGLNYKTETFDRFIAKSAKFDPGKRPAYHLGTTGNAWEKDALGNIIPKYPVGYTALQSYNVIFNNGNYPESGGTQIVSSRRDLLTRVMEDYTRVISGRQIGSSDKIILTNALDSISDLQKGLMIQVTNACIHKDQDKSAMYNKNIFPIDEKLSMANYVKLITAIFNCDISRVITICFSPGDLEDWTSYPTKDYHGNITHKSFELSNNIPNWKLIGQLYGRNFDAFVAPLLTSLNGCIDPANNKSFLDNGLVHLTAETNYPHRQANVPTVTVGSWNGSLPTGYMVNYSDPTRPFTFGGGIINGEAWSDDPKDATDPMNDNHSYDYPGIPYQRFLVTLLQTLGFQRSDYEDPALNKHLLNRSDSRYGTINNGITDVGGYGSASWEKIDQLDEGQTYHHNGRMTRYNWHYYKNPIPLPPKAGG